jgi:DNA-binding SARP family transcriptional activator
VIGERPIRIGLGAQRLVALLVLSGTAVNRRRAAQTLWPDAPTGRAGANLRSTLWRLQQAIPFVVEADATSMRLGVDIVVDAWQLYDLSRRLLDRSRPFRETEIREALLINLQYDLLPEWEDEEWLREERERYRQLRMHTLESLCERLAAAGWFGAAVDVGLAAVRADPFRESARIALIGAYVAEGNVADACRLYECYRRQLNEELGIEPATPYGRVVEIAALRRAAVDEIDATSA